jgi:arylsulfatase A-like enzyme
MRIDRRKFLALTSAAAAVGASAAAGAQGRRRSTGERPNVLFIMADDLGYADVGCFGAPGIATPNIDGLARDGLLFTDGYSGSSVCSPTRVSLITGRYPGRNAASLDEPLAAHPDWGLDPATPTFVAALRASGYQTSLVGKWHLGHRPQFSPLRHGYQHFFGIRSGGADYFSHVGINDEPDLWEDDEHVDRHGYLTDLLGARAAAEVRRMAGRPEPFLLSLHFNAPHWPWETEGDEAVSRNLHGLYHADGGSAATYRNMVETMDRNIGLVLDALRRSGRAQDTIVVFTSDNGGERFSNTWPFSGRKGELLEGGIRVPLIVRWPRRVPRGTRTAQVAISMDWAATFLDAAAARPPGFALDGMSLLPQLGGAASVERTLYWRHKAHDQKAVRRGDLKYLSIGGKDYLFDVRADPLERANHAQRDRAAFEALKAAWVKWNAEMMPYPADAESADNKGRTADRY